MISEVRPADPIFGQTLAALIAMGIRWTCGVVTLNQGFGIGGAEGDRTPDLMTASHALSQLSYGPEGEWSAKLTAMQTSLAILIQSSNRAV